ncbi:extracellular solute-binding protein [Dongia deserti]|uniref:extracellular solute-binding protein n=1 Tax=Dongia deserti TaxID=2268030 RepID=UPI000E646CF5|nr:extracellular solute-binding protein [Dongia deserti]
MISKAGLLATFTAFALIATLNAAEAQERQLFIYNWSDYIGSTTIEDFEKETGIKITYDLFDSYETMDARVQAGASGYDIIFPGRQFVQHHVKQDLYYPLDKSKLKNLGNIDPKFWEVLQVSDPGNKYAVPYMFWTNGFVYDEKKIKAIDPDAPVDSWDMFFKPEVLSKFTKCGTSVLDSPEDVIDLALNYLGLHPGKSDPEEVKKAADLVGKMRPNLAAFDSVGTIGALADGSRCLAMTWSGDYAQAAARAEEAGVDVALKYATPKEGVNMDYDTMAILKDAKNIEEAHMFIDYMLRPEVIAKITNEIGYANANKAATPLVDEAIRNDPAMYPDPERLANVYVTELRTPEEARLIVREFTRAKTGQ